MNSSESLFQLAHNQSNCQQNDMQRFFVSHNFSHRVQAYIIFLFIRLDYYLLSQVIVLHLQPQRPHLALTQCFQRSNNTIQTKTMPLSDTRSLFFLKFVNKTVLKLRNHRSFLRSAHRHAIHLTEPDWRRALPAAVCLLPGGPTITSRRTERALPFYFRSPKCVHLPTR